MNDLIDIKLTRCRHSLEVEVCLPPGDERSLESIDIVLDGIRINPERAGRHHRIRRYARQFQQIVRWFPGPEHTLVVTARSQDGLESFATLCWNQNE